MKIGIVGSGMVGSTSAFTLVMNGAGRKIVLVDRTRSRAEANAGDTILVVVSKSSRYHDPSGGAFRRRLRHAVHPAISRKSGKRESKV